MIVIKNEHEIEAMKRAGRIAAAAREAAGAFIEAGTPDKMTTADVDRVVARTIRENGASATFLGYGGFPASACVSVNEEVIHGIPGERRLHSGDIVKVDVGATFDGFVGDCAATFFVGTPSDRAKNLANATRQSFWEAMKFARVGFRLSDISHAVQSYAEERGYGVIREYVGHGVGRKMHEDPEVPNFGNPGRGPRLLPGMTFAVEPMIAEGTWEVKRLANQWTVVTVDGKLAAHYENTILITQGDPVILTHNEMNI